MQEVRRLIRLVILALWVAVGVLLTASMWGPHRLKLLSMHTILGAAAWWYRRLLGIINAHVTVAGNLSQQPGMWVSNHISWLDIIVIGSRARVHFVSKSEVSKWPVVGFLARQTGTLFLRRGANESAKMTSAMSDRIKGGHGVLFFPEGTTGQGHFLRRFHPRLFAAALELQCPVVPLAIRYEHDEQPHPVVAYTDGQNLMDNLWQILRLKRLDITLFVGDPITELPEKRRELADLARERVRQALGFAED